MRSSLLVLLLLSTSLPSYAGKDSKNLDILAEMKTDGIYEQKQVLRRFPQVLKQEGLSELFTAESISKMGEKDVESFSAITSTISANQSSKALNEELKNEFMTLKRKAMRNVLLEKGFPFALDCGFTTFFGLSGFLGNFGAGMALFKALKSFETFMGDLSSGGVKIYDLESDELFKHELEYVNKKRFFPKTLQVAVEDRLATARKDPKNLKDVITDYFPTVLSLPTQTKQPSSEFEKTLRELTKGYIVKGKESLGDILVNAAMTHYSNFKKGLGYNSAPKPILYIIGPAGVGKTYISLSLARGLQLSLHKVSLSGGTAKVFGDKNNPGQFLEAITRPGAALNDVVFFDEANHSLNGGVVSKNLPGTDMINPTKTKLTQNSDQASWLEFFDPEAKEKFFPFLNAEEDISHYLFVCAANDVPQNAALRNRMTIIEVTGLEPEFKKEIVWDHILPKLMKSEDPLMDLTKSDLNTEKINEIISEAEKKEELSIQEKKEERAQPIEEDEEEDIGFRTIKKDLQVYLNKIRLERLNVYNQDKKGKLGKDGYLAVDIPTEKGTEQEEGLGVHRRNIECYDSNKLHNLLQLMV